MIYYLILHSSWVCNCAFSKSFRVVMTLVYDISIFNLKSEHHCSKISLSFFKVSQSPLLGWCHQGIGGCILIPLNLTLFRVLVFSSCCWVPTSILWIRCCSDCNPGRGPAFDKASEFFVLKTVWRCGNNSLLGCWWIYPLHSVAWASQEEYFCPLDRMLLLDPQRGDEIISFYSYWFPGLNWGWRCYRYRFLQI